MRNFGAKAFALALAVLVGIWIYCLTQIPEPMPEMEPAITEPVPERVVAQEIEEAPAAEVQVLDLEKLPQCVNATLTHYCVCKRCCGKDETHPAYGITASGRKAEPYVSVAVDPFFIPLGSTVYIDYGDGVLHEYRADDTGSGVSGAHIDLCVASHAEADQLGVQTVRVYWKEGGSDGRGQL